MRGKYSQDVRNAGPKSKLLQGLDLADGPIDATSTTVDGGDTLDRSQAAPTSPRGGTLLRNLDPANPPQLEQGHVVVVVVGAVSKGIISRNQRHNAGLFQSLFKTLQVEILLQMNY